MPTVLRQGRWIVKIYAPPREHPPPHVHVLLGHTGEVIILLGTENTAPTVWAVHRMRGHDVVRAYRLVETHHAQLVTAWEALHGTTLIE